MKQHPYQSFEPGKGYEYSNSNYYLLGIIGELTTGRMWHEEIRDRFLDLANPHNGFFPRSLSIDPEAITRRTGKEYEIARRNIN